MRTEDGDRRTLLVVTDERAGAAASAECPGGGLHVYDITGDRVQDPLANKLGTWFIPAVQPQGGATCTSHVLRIYPRQEMLTIAWYSQGVRVLDISGLADAPVDPGAIAFGDGIGMTEIGHYTFPDSDAWSFKTNRINRDGSFVGYANDLTRGFDVFRFRGGESVPPLVPRDPRRAGSAGHRGRWGRTANLAEVIGTLVDVDIAAARVRELLAAAGGVTIELLLAGRGVGRRHALAPRRPHALPGGSVLPCACRAQRPGPRS